MGFEHGDQVEVASKEKGFVGSYYRAKILSPSGHSSGFYWVQYKTLVTEDQSAYLRELVPAAEIRPVPPRIPATKFSVMNEVDAFDNDGWWWGKITGKRNSEYSVYFPTTGDEVAYPISRLRPHLEWSSKGNKWEASNPNH